MDAKWNWLIDNRPLRAAINSVALVAWTWIAIGILEVAARY